MNIDKLYMKFCEKEEKIGWENFTHEEKVFVDLMIFWYEIGNGGLRQYYINDSGNTAVNVPDLLKEINDSIISKKLLEINSKFGNKGPDKDRNKRQKELEKNQGQIEPMMQKFDNLINNSDELEELLIAYAERCKFIL